MAGTPYYHISSLVIYLPALAQARASEKKPEKAESMEAEQDKSIFVTSCLCKIIIYYLFVR